MTAPRACGSCTLCCKLLPMQREDNPGERWANAMAAMGSTAFGMRNEFDKPAGRRCPHQRLSKGCTIYASRPFSCRVWNCLWLTGDDTASLARPDRSHYVIDAMPDYVTLRNNETGEHHRMPVVVIWIDPGYPGAHRDPALRAFLARRGTAALVHLSESKGLTLFPPAISHDGQWHEVRSDAALPQHDIADIVATLGVTVSLK